MGATSLVNVIAASRLWAAAVAEVAASATRAAKLSTHPFDMRRSPILANMVTSRQCLSTTLSTTPAHKTPGETVRSLDSKLSMIAYTTFSGPAQQYFRVGIFVRERVREGNPHEFRPGGCSSAPTGCSRESSDPRI